MINEKKFTPEKYPDLLEKIGLDSDMIFKTIEPYPLNFPQTRNKSVEWGIKFPMFVDSFYEYLINNNSIPTQQVFFEHYLSFNQSFFEEKNFDLATIEGLKARVYRTYPSLVRDLYFNKYVKENLPETIVTYNKTLDIVEGIDLMIKKDNSFYAVNLYTDTRLAYSARRKKQHRHTAFKNVNYIEFPVNFKGSLKCGNFFLYGKSELLQLKSIIKL